MRSQSRTVRSWPPVTSQWLFGLIATARTWPSWPRSKTELVFYVEKAIELVSLGREGVIERGGIGFAVHRAVR
jgi:hypothetical protein